MTAPEPGRTARAPTTAPRCDFCGLQCPPVPVTAEVDGELYEFCSEICRDALEDGDGANEAFHGFKRFDPGVPVLARQLPEGMLRNSLVLVADEAGARGDALLVELVWHALQRGGSAVVVAYQEPPISVIEQFLGLRWNVIPYLESGQLQLVDCFTYRVEEAERMVDRMNRWNRHLHRAAAGVTESVRDPTDLRSVEHKLDDRVEAAGIDDRGLIAFDSLTELGTLVQPVQAYDFVKDIRADFAKGRFVPVFARAPYHEENDAFPHDLTYMMDGTVEMTLADEDHRPSLPRLRVRKMRGVPTTAEWTPYEYVAGQGLVARRRPAPPAATPGAGPAGDGVDGPPR